MASKEIAMGKWFTYGWLYGFGIGINISKNYISLDLAFWYVGFEF